MAHAPTTRRVRKVSLNAIYYLALVALALFFAFPFLSMLVTSFMNYEEATALPKLIFPRHPTLEAYGKLFRRPEYLRYFGNTLLVSVLELTGMALSSSLCAYGFAKLRFKGREVIFACVLATMMLPGIVTQIPLYVMYLKLGWFDTLTPLWLPAWFGGGAVNIFMVRQFMKGIPDDVLNAAKMDGANFLQIFFCLMVPLCFPIILFVAVNAFFGAFNDFMGPLLYLMPYSEKSTLPLGLYLDYATSKIGVSNPPNDSMAAGVLMFLPCAAVFLLFQKTLMNGVTFTGLKG